MSTRTTETLKRFDGAAIVPTACTLAVHVKLCGGVREVVVTDNGATAADRAAAVKAIGERKCQAESTENVTYQIDPG